MYRSPKRRGLSKLAIPIALVAILVVAGGYVFLTQGSGSNSSTTQSSTASQSSIPVNTAVNQFMQDLNSRSVDNMVSFYSPNAVSVWSGNTGGLSGMYTGTNSIRLIYATTVGKDHQLDANLSDYKERVVSPAQTNVTFVVNLVANSTTAGIVTANIDVSQQWNLGSSGWQITKENWSYQLFDSTLIDQGLGSATTFPQWGYAVKGGNPNLVGEKSFEWHAGPYVAASVYAFLIGVVALTVLKFRSRRALPRREGGGISGSQRRA